MAYDVSKMADWQIAEAACEHMPTPQEWQEKLGLKKDEMLAYGKVGKVDFLKVMERLKNKPDGKYIEVTAVTHTPGSRQKCRSAPQKQPSAKGAISMPVNGGAIGPPRTTCFAATDILCERPAIAAENQAARP